MYAICTSKLKLHIYMCIYRHIYINLYVYVYMYVCISIYNVYIESMCIHT